MTGGMSMRATAVRAWREPSTALTLIVTMCVVPSLAGPAGSVLLYLTVRNTVCQLAIGSEPVTVRVSEPFQLAVNEVPVVLAVRMSLVLGLVMVKVNDSGTPSASPEGAALKVAESGS